MVNLPYQILTMHQNFVTVEFGDGGNQAIITLALTCYRLNNKCMEHNYIIHMDVCMPIYVLHVCVSV